MAKRERDAEGEDGKTRPLWLVLTAAKDQPGGAAVGFQRPAANLFGVELDDDVDNEEDDDDEAVAVEVIAIVEYFHPRYKEARELLDLVAEPRSRTARVHTYAITENSLYTAVSLGYDAGKINAKLKEQSKIGLPDDIKAFVEERAARAGKVRLVLQPKKVLGEVQVTTTWDGHTKVEQKAEERLVNYIEAEPQYMAMVTANPEVKTKFMASDVTEEKQEDDQSNLITIHKFEVRQDASLIELKKLCKEKLSLPLDAVYAFREDDSTQDAKFQLKPTARLRPYQSLSLNKAFGSGRARSGLIVLPCGAGKTLTGVACTATIGKTTMVLCINNVTVRQWWQQFVMWGDIDRNRVTMFTSDVKQDPGDIVITTYSMVGYPDAMRTDASFELMEKLRGREWGLLLLDEVHVAPAKTFRNVFDRIKCHCVIGLTATLLREDRHIGDLGYLIGPKLYEANWQELAQAGYLAEVMCVEVRCPMQGLFYEAYLLETDLHTRGNLYNMNPVKLLVTQAIIAYHQKRGDKILLFSDSVPVIEYYAELLHLPFLHGDVSEAERMCIINHFKYDDTMNAMILSRVAETGLDIPDANVIIQISSFYGSQRQEAQRLGRILRPKSSGDNGFYYSLVASDTREALDNQKRRRFLLDQGYAFKVVDAQTILSYHSQSGGSLLMEGEEGERELLEYALEGCRAKRASGKGGGKGARKGGKGKGGKGR